MKYQISTTPTEEFSLVHRPETLDETERFTLVHKRKDGQDWLSHVTILTKREALLLYKAISDCILNKTEYPVMPNK